jgi:hypothetical protein
VTHGDNYAPSAAHDDPRSNHHLSQTGELEGTLATRKSSSSLRLAERKRLDQNSRGARLSYREGSPLGLTVEVFCSRKLCVAL